MIDAMNVDDSTLNVYNNHAKTLSERFNKSWVRSENIALMFSYFTNSKILKLLEIWCWNWRDAKEILKYTSNYIGLDYSQGMLDLAKEFLPGANFELWDIESFETKDKFDIIYSFSSLVHLPKERLEKVMKKLFILLNDNWIVYLSLKYNPEYTEHVVSDELWERFFALYNDNTVKNISDGFEIIFEKVSQVNKNFWLEMILKKQG